MDMLGSEADEISKDNVLLIFSLSNSLLPSPLLLTHLIVLVLTSLRSWLQRRRLRKKKTKLFVSVSNSLPFLLTHLTVLLLASF